MQNAKNAIIDRKSQKYQQISDGNSRPDNIVVKKKKKVSAWITSRAISVKHFSSDREALTIFLENSQEGSLQWEKSAESSLACEAECGTTGEFCSL